MKLPVRLIIAAATSTSLAIFGANAFPQTAPSAQPDANQQSKATTPPGARGEDPHYPNKTDMSAGRNRSAAAPAPMHRNDAADPSGTHGNGTNGG